MIVISKPAKEMRRQWRQQILAHRIPRSVAARSGFVALTFMDQSNTSSAFIDISSLLVVLLYEDASHTHDRVPLRLSGYRVTRVPHGVQWGGAANSILFKDLVLTPQHRARGQRIDRSKDELLTMALKLDRRLSRAARHAAAPWPGLRLPRLWAGFRPSHAHDLRGEGPEFERACRRRRVTPSAMFRDSARHVEGLTAYPLDWVSGQLDSATGIFAEVTPGMRRQVCRMDRLPQGVVGFQGASAFDFYNSRFRRLPGKRPVSQGDGCPKELVPQNPLVETQLMQTGGLVA